MYRMGHNSINLGIKEAGMTCGREIWPAWGIRNEIHSQDFREMGLDFRLHIQDRF